MIAFYSLLPLILTIVQANINEQNLLTDYAPKYGNYKSSDKILEEEEKRHEEEEYVFLEPSDVTRLELNRGPSRHISPKQYTFGHRLYNNLNQNLIKQFQNNGRYGVTLLPRIKAKRDDEKVRNDNINWPDIDIGTGSKPKTIVKKNNAETHFSNPGNVKNTQRSSEIYQNPTSVQIDNLNIPQNEKEILHRLAMQQQSHSEFIPQSQTQNGANEYQGFQIIIDDDDVENQNNQNYQAIPYGRTPQIISNLYTMPIYNPQQIQQQQQQQRPFVGMQAGNLNDGDSSKVQHILSLINTQPDIHSKLLNLHEYKNIPQYNQNIQEPANEERQHTTLSSQKNYPLILIDANAKLGLPFYPSTKEATLSIEHQDNFDYEGIPRVPNKTDSEESENSPIADRRSSVGGFHTDFQFPNFENIPVNFHPFITNGIVNSDVKYNRYPSGYTRETIWNAGDPTANRDPEILVRQLNETCAYFRFNETIPSTEDGKKPNIWQAGDHTAQQQGEELIRSVNVTCDNFTEDYMNNFTSGYSLYDYCSQCLHSDSDNSSDGQTYYLVPTNNYEENSEEFTGVNYQPTSQFVYYDNKEPNTGKSNGEIAGFYNTNPLQEEYFKNIHTFDRNKFG